MTVHDKDFPIVENISGRINIADAKKGLEYLQNRTMFSCL